MEEIKNLTIENSKKIVGLKKMLPCHVELLRVFKYKIIERHRCRI
jgi:hypothetical protein